MSKPDKMKLLLAGALNTYLPPIQEIHAVIAMKGFVAWRAFLDERLALLTKQEEIDSERTAIYLLCRERFCNLMGWHFVNRGGEYCHLAELDALRQRDNNPIAGLSGDLLRSNVILRRDLYFAAQFGQRANAKFRAALRSEFNSALNDCLPHLIGADPDFETICAHLVKYLGDKGGFRNMPVTEQYDIGKLKRSLSTFAAVSIGIGQDESENIVVQFWLELASRNNRDVVIPIDIAALVPEFAGYGSRAFVLPSNDDSPAYSDVSSKECWASKDEGEILVRASPSSNTSRRQMNRLAHIALTCKAYLSLYSAVEKNICAAVDSISKVKE